MAGETFSTHFKDDEPRFKSTFTGVDNSTPTDPDGVQFDAVAPDDSRTTFVFGVDAELVKQAVGVYYVDFLLDQEMRYDIWFQATGDNAKSDKHIATVLTRP